MYIRKPHRISVEDKEREKATHSLLLSALFLFSFSKRTRCPRKLQIHYEDLGTKNDLEDEHRGD